MCDHDGLESNSARLVPQMSTGRVDYFAGRNIDRYVMREILAKPRGEYFICCLEILTALIRRLARGKGLESATELSLLDETIKLRPYSMESSWLLPTIRTALSTRLQALIQLEYGDLDICLDRFADGLRGLSAGHVIDSAMLLQLLRQQIKTTGKGQFSTWLLGSIDAALGREVILLWEPGRTEHRLQ